MIKQPELGKILLKARKQKGWTQEELVDQCHVSVRTIQRIESGEVTPRSSTIKILLSALEYDMAQWEKSKANRRGASFKQKFKKMLLTNATEQNARNVLTTAWIAGIVYFVVGFIEMGAEYMHFEGQITSITDVFGYGMVKLLAAASFFIFMRGFIALGQLFDNYLLKVIATLYALAIVVTSILDVFMVIYFPEDWGLNTLYGSSYSILYGIIEIVFGVALFRLDGMGSLSRVAGVLEIVTGFFFVTVILFFLGLITLTPALIVEIVLLIKAEELVRKNEI